MSVYILALERGSSFIWQLARFTEYLTSGCNLENKSIEYLEVDKSIEYSEAEIMSEYLKLWTHLHTANENWPSSVEWVPVCLVLNRKLLGYTITKYNHHVPPLDVKLDVLLISQWIVMFQQEWRRFLTHQRSFCYQGRGIRLLDL